MSTERDLLRDLEACADWLAEIESHGITPTPDSLMRTEALLRRAAAAIPAPVQHGWGTTAPTYFKGRLKVEYVYGRGDRPWALTGAMTNSAGRPVIGYYENPAQAMFDADARFAVLQ